MNTLTGLDDKNCTAPSCRLINAAVTALAQLDVGDIEPHASAIIRLIIGRVCRKMDRESARHSNYQSGFKLLGIIHSHRQSAALGDIRQELSTLGVVLARLGPRVLTANQIEVLYKHFKGHQNAFVEIKGIDFDTWPSTSALPIGRELGLARNDSWHIFVNNRTYHVHPRTTTRDLFDMVEGTEGIPSDQQRLYFCGTKLEHGVKLLLDYGVTRPIYCGTDPYLGVRVIPSRIDIH